MGAGFLPSLGPPDAGARFVGIQKEVTVPNPAPGADWSYKIGGGVWERISLVAARLTSAAAVANRVPAFLILDGDGQGVWAWAPQTAQTATQVVTYGGAAGTPYVDHLAAGLYTFAIPSLWLPAGYSVVTATTGIQAADQWSNLKLLVEELDRGPLGENIGTDSGGY